MVKQLFLSHAWGKDGLDRDNHKRCKELYEKLVNKNYTVWIDDNEMYGNIDSAIMKGINNAKVIIICLTKTYCDKINNAAANNLPNDNCYKEWNYSLFKQKLIIPIIMEPQMNDIYLKQDGIIQMYFNSTLYIDASEDLDTAVNKICFTLKNHSIYGQKFSNKFKNIKKLDSILTLLNFKTFFHDIALNSHSPTKPKSPNKHKSPKSIMKRGLSLKIWEQDKTIIEPQKSSDEILSEFIERKSKISGRLSPLSNRSDNRSILNSLSPIGRRSNSISSNTSGRLSPFNKLVISNRLSPIDQAAQKDMTKSITRDIEKHFKNDMKKDITKEIKKDLKKDLKHEIKKDLKKDLKKDITKNIQKSLLTGMILNNTITTDDSSEINTSSSDKDSASDKDESDGDIPNNTNNTNNTNNSIKIENERNNSHDNDCRPNSAPIPIKYNVKGHIVDTGVDIVTPCRSARGNSKNAISSTMRLNQNKHSSEIINL